MNRKIGCGRDTKDFKNLGYVRTFPRFKVILGQQPATSGPSPALNLDNVTQLCETFN